MEGLITGNLTDEVYREYEFLSGKTYRINNPKTLFRTKSGSTHRVLDGEGIVHCIAFPGEGVVLRWKPRNARNPVAF